MEAIFLWTNEIPNENKPKRESSQIFNTINNVTKITEATNPSMVVFKPTSSVDNGIGIII